MFPLRSILAPAKFAWVWRSTEFTERLSLVRRLASASSVLGDFCVVIQNIPQERIPKHVASKSLTDTYRRFCRFEPRALATADSGVDWVGLVQIVPHRSVFLNVSLNSPSMCHYVTFLSKPAKWSRILTTLSSCPVIQSWRTSS